VAAGGGWPWWCKANTSCLLEVWQSVQLWIFTHEWAPVCTLGRG